MAELSEGQKLELVSMLACFREPATIIAYFRQEHGLELSHKQVGGYDPTRSYFEGSDRWRTIFAEKRRSYLEEVTSIPIANQGFRLNLLNELVMKAVRENKPALAAKLLEQAARDVGASRWRCRLRCGSWIAARRRGRAATRCCSLMPGTSSGRTAARTARLRRSTSSFWATSCGCGGGRGTRTIHEPLPPAPTARINPSPSPCRPGLPKAAFTAVAVSLPIPRPHFPPHTVWRLVTDSNEHERPSAESRTSREPLITAANERPRI